MITRTSAAASGACEGPRFDFRGFIFLFSYPESVSGASLHISITTGAGGKFQEKRPGPEKMLFF